MLLEPITTDLYTFHEVELITIGSSLLIVTDERLLQLN